MKTEITTIKAKDVEKVCDYLSEQFTAGESMFICLHLAASLYKAVNGREANLSEFRDFATQAFELADGDSIECLPSESN